jgi:hypothetical protein
MFPFIDLVSYVFILALHWDNVLRENEREKWSCEREKWIFNLNGASFGQTHGFDLGNFGKLGFKRSHAMHVTYFPSFLTDQVDGRF